MVAAKYPFELKAAMDKANDDLIKENQYEYEKWVKSAVVAISRNLKQIEKLNQENEAIKQQLRTNEYKTPIKVQL